MRPIICYIWLSFLFWGFAAQAQHTPKDQWLSINQLTDSLAQQPKRTLLYFYTDWCTYCKKMDRNALQNNRVQQQLQSLYAVKMKATTTDTIRFGSQVFTNKQALHKRQGFHEFALLLGKRKKAPYSVPVVILLDEQFKVLKRSFSYMTTEEWLRFLGD